jgi:hypothetical protein
MGLIHNPNPPPTADRLLNRACVSQQALQDETRVLDAQHQQYTTSLLPHHQPPIQQFASPPENTTPYYAERLMNGLYPSATTVTTALTLPHNSNHPSLMAFDHQRIQTVEPLVARPPANKKIKLVNNSACEATPPQPPVLLPQQSLPHPQPLHQHANGFASEAKPGAGVDNKGVQTAAIPLSESARSTASGTFFNFSTQTVFGGVVVGMTVSPTEH